MSDADDVVAFYDGVAGLGLSYENDFLHRLAGVSGTYTRTYAYDPLGNLTNKAGIEQSYDNPAHPHAVTARSDGKTYGYDLNGNMVYRDGQTLAWDAENRLTQVVSGTTTRFVYDGQGVRVKKEGVGGGCCRPGTSSRSPGSGVSSRDQTEMPGCGYQDQRLFFAHAQIVL